MSIKSYSQSHNNSLPQSVKAYALILCICIGMSQWKFANSLVIPQHASSGVASIASYSSSSTTWLSMGSSGGNFQNRMSRHGRLPEDMQEDDEQPALSWDWDDEDDNNNNDMFGQSQQPQSTDRNEDAKSGVHSGDIAGAKLSEDMKQKAKNSHLNSNEESSGGGSKFRELVARASTTSAATSSGGNANRQPPQAPVMPAQTQQLSNGVSIPSNPMDLSIQEQAAIFRQLVMKKQVKQQEQNPYSQEMAQYQKQQQQVERKMADPYQTAPPRVYGPPLDLRHPYAQPQQQEAQPPPQPGTKLPPKDYREYGTGDDGRRIGRNKDAEAMSSAADVYMAQLRRDSTSRNYARYAGDEEVANAVFHDPSIQSIHTPENPYRRAKLERERDSVETIPEEMLIFQDYSTEEAQAAPRLNYKEELAKHRKIKQQGRQQ